MTRPTVSGVTSGCSPRSYCQINLFPNLTLTISKHPISMISVKQNPKTTLCKLWNVLSVRICLQDANAHLRAKQKTMKDGMRVWKQNSMLSTAHDSWNNLLLMRHSAMIVINLLHNKVSLRTSRSLHHYFFSACNSFCFFFFWLLTEGCSAESSRCYAVLGCNRQLGLRKVNLSFEYL